MPLYHTSHTEEEELLIAIWKVTESEEELVSPLPNGHTLLHEARERFTAPSRRLEWLAVRRLLHEVGCHSHIEYHPSGRPYLTDDQRHLSITHTRGYAAIALHGKCPVGIDIEQYGEKVRRVKTRFVSAEEEQTIISLHQPPHDLSALLVMWSAKEALFKLIDCEGIDFAEDLHIHPFTLNAPCTFTAHETFTPDKRSFNLCYRLFPDFVFVYGTESGKK